MRQSRSHCCYHCRPGRANQAPLNRRYPTDGRESHLLGTTLVGWKTLRHKWQKCMEVGVAAEGEVVGKGVAVVESAMVGVGVAAVERAAGAGGGMAGTAVDLAAG